MKRSAVLAAAFFLAVSVKSSEDILPWAGIVSRLHSPVLLRIDIEVLPIPGGGIGTLWAAYGASVDNVSGDSWSSIAFNVAGSP